MCKKELTEFGKEIKFELIMRNKTQNWLINQVRSDTGMYVDTSVLYRIMTGSLHSPRIISSICQVLGISESIDSIEMEKVRK